MSGDTTTSDPRLDKKLLRVADVAPMTGWSPQRIYQLIAEGRIPHVRIGRSICIPATAWQQWLDAMGTTAQENMSVGLQGGEYTV